MNASAVARLESLCDGFEAAWRRGERPRVEEAIAGLDPAERREFLRELHVLELAYRGRLGERPTLAEYRDRFPDDVGLVADAFGAATTAGGPAAPPRGHLPAVAGFEVLGELGRGGMGIVYQARSVRLNRPVALKMILAGAYAGPEAAARFLSEAEAVARLQHPSIVQVFSLGDHEGLPYLEMEYASGGSLAASLDGRPRPAREAARLVETIVRAVHHAHGQGIVHRDLKPANVLLAADGSPKVTDFGLAKLLDADAGLTRTESVLGSPSYMAPEQAEGRHKDVGPAADVYSLGAIFYELLTGRPPFRGATAIETLLLVKTADPTPPSRLAPVPRDAATIALACLQKEPHRRYESAEALADDLARFVRGEPIRARPVGPLERAWKWAARRPATAALAGTCAVLLLLLVLAARRGAALIPMLPVPGADPTAPRGLASMPRLPAPDPTAERPLTADQYIHLLEEADRLRIAADRADSGRLGRPGPEIDPRRLRNTGDPRRRRPGCWIPAREPGAAGSGTATSSAAPAVRARWSAFEATRGGRLGRRLPASTAALVASAGVRRSPPSAPGTPALGRPGLTPPRPRRARLQRRLQPRRLPDRLGRRRPLGDRLGPCYRPTHARPPRPYRQRPLRRVPPRRSPRGDGQLGRHGPPLGRRDRRDGRRPQRGGRLHYPPRLQPRRPAPRRGGHEGPGPGLGG